MVEQIARFLVDEPEHVSVSAIESEQQTILQLRVAKNDIGKSLASTEGLPTP